MKRLYTKTFTNVCLLTLGMIGFAGSHAQGIYRLWGTTSNGGTNGAGVIFSSAADGSDLQAEFSLPGNSGGKSPEGSLTLYGSYLYGTTYLGGVNDAGVIFKYNLETKAYTKVFDFGGINGANPYGGGLTLFNNKFYGVAQYGGTSDNGVLFEYDPTSDIVTKKIDMASVGIARPLGCLLEYNNKLYGISHTGGTNTAGSLFVYDPTMNTCSILYSFKSGASGSDGYYPAFPMLALYNNRLYGTTLGGGLYNSGTIFQFDLLLNTYSTIHHFSNPDGRTPGSGITVYNNKLYGLAGGGSDDAGILFEYDLASATYSKKFDFTVSSGHSPQGNLLLYNNRLYGLTSYGNQGVFEFNPLTGTVMPKSGFTGANGLTAKNASLIQVPVPTAAGTPGSCQNIGSITINSTNNNEWVPIIDPATKKAVAEIHAKGNILGTVSAWLYVHNGSVREDYLASSYLDRNITLIAATPPSSPIDIRLYIDGTELEALKTAINSLGKPSGVASITDINIFKSPETCSNMVSEKALPLPTTGSVWGWKPAPNNYVLQATTSTLGSFYFAKNTIIVLPIQLLSFTATATGTTAKIEWSGLENNATQPYELQYSKDGVAFSKLAAIPVKAQQGTNTYQYTHRNLTSGTQYYRLKLTDADGTIHYSSIKPVKTQTESSYSIRVLQNPLNSEATIITDINTFQHLCFTLYNNNGQQVWKKEVHLTPGTHTLAIPANNFLTSGIYRLTTMNTSGEKQYLSFLK